MKLFPSRRAAPAAPSSSSPVDRRSLVVGAGVAGAAAIGAAALHRSVVEAPVEAAPAAAAGEEGYRLTPHVLRYYETTRT